MNSPSPLPASRGPQVTAVTRPASAPALGRLFSVLLMLAAATSVLSTIAFIGYLVIPAVTTQSRTHYTLLYETGITGLVIAEVCQILGVVLLIVQWLSRSTIRKSPRELLVLLVSLIPYMVAVICLITLIVYLRARRHDPTSERTQEAAQELKEQAADTFIDAGANVASSAAGTPVSAPPSSRHTMQDAVRRVVGPSTGKSISDSTHVLVAFTAVALIASAVTTVGVVVPAKGLAPLQAAQEADLAGTWTFTYSITSSNCGNDIVICNVKSGTGSIIIQRTGTTLIITLPHDVFLIWTETFKGTISGDRFTAAFSDFELAEQCSGQMNGTVVTSTQLRGRMSVSCTETDAVGVSGGSRFDWTATPGTH